jgi:hypothetical protein
MKKAIVKNQNPTALATVNPIDEMFGGPGYQIPVDAPLPAIKILRESAQYEMPDGQYSKEFTGHILHWHNANQYYSTPYGEGESRYASGLPDCFSSDGRNPDGGQFMQTGPCKTCQLNQFKSAEDKVAKACQNTIRMYVLVDGEVIPCLVKAPPSSLGKKDSLMKWLTTAANIAAKAGMGTKYQPIQVKFSLRKKDFNSGTSASVIEIQTLRVLDKDKDADKLKQLCSLYNEFMSSYLGRIQTDIANEATKSE